MNKSIFQDHTSKTTNIQVINLPSPSGLYVNTFLRIAGSFLDSSKFLRYCEIVKKRILRGVAHTLLQKISPFYLLVVKLITRRKKNTPEMLVSFLSFFWCNHFTTGLVKHVRPLWQLNFFFLSLEKNRIVFWNCKSCGKFQFTCKDVDEVEIFNLLTRLKLNIFRPNELNKNRYFKLKDLRILLGSLRQGSEIIPYMKQKCSYRRMTNVNSNFRFSRVTWSKWKS